MSQTKKKANKKLWIIICAVIVIAAIVCAVVLIKGKGAKQITFAIPNDTTNEARALLLLEANGYITLNEGAGITATPRDIKDNPKNIQFSEVEAAQIPNTLKDVDYAIINNNYALQAGLQPATDSLLIEDADSPYVNVVSVKEGNEETDAAKALAAALKSQTIVDFINNTYGGAAVATVTDITDGFDPTVDYEALKGTTISIAATPVPHVEVLQEAAKILAEKEITLEIKEVTDYVTPNEFVENGDVFANYFAHQPYQDSFNEGNGTHLVTIAGIHVEPMALYGGKQTDLTALGIE